MALAHERPSSQRLDQAPMTWLHYALWFVAIGGALIDGWTVATLGLALPLLKKDFALDSPSSPGSSTTPRCCPLRSLPTRRRRLLMPRGK